MKCGKITAAAIAVASMGAVALPGAASAKTYAIPHCDNATGRNHECAIRAPFTIWAATPGGNTKMRYPSDTFEFHVTGPTRVTVSIRKVGGPANAYVSTQITDGRGDIIGSSQGVWGVDSPPVGSMFASTFSFVAQPKHVSGLPVGDYSMSVAGARVLDDSSPSIQVPYVLTVSSQSQTAAFSPLQCRYEHCL
jgi:hypothetical protein